MARNSRSTFRRGISETQRRKKAWVGMNSLPESGADMSGGRLLPPPIVAIGDSLTLLQFASQPGFQESTILRIRGTIEVPKSDYSGSLGGNTITAFGIGVVSDAAAEATAVPNPATETGYDWDGWLFLRQSTVGPLDANATIMDVKAMRKWKSGDSIIFVAGASTDNAAGYTSLAVAFSLRGLFLLP